MIIITTRSPHSLTHSLTHSLKNCLQVIPSGLGVAQPFYYFVLPSYWCPGAHKGKNVEIQSDALDAVVEPVSSELEEQVQGVRVRVRSRCKG